MQCIHTVRKVRLGVTTQDVNVGPAVIRGVLYEKDVYVYLIPNPLELEEYGRCFMDYSVRGGCLL